MAMAKDVANRIGFVKVIAKRDSIAKEPAKINSQTNNQNINLDKNPTDNNLEKNPV